MLVTNCVPNRSERPEVPFGVQVGHFLDTVVEEGVPLISAKARHVETLRVPVRDWLVVNLAEFAEVVFLEILSLLLIGVIMAALVPSGFAAVLAKVTHQGR